MFLMVPKYAFITKGVGKSKEKLTSFEMCLRDAGIAEYNLVRVLLYTRKALDCHKKWEISGWIQARARIIAWVALE